MNSTQKKIVGAVAAIAVILALAGGAFGIVSSMKGRSAAQAAEQRLNTLTLIRNYVDRGEYDRALNLLDELLIKNPEDPDAHKLMEAVLSAKKAQEALDSGSGEAAELRAALEAARQAVSRIVITSYSIHYTKLYEYGKDFRSRTGVLHDSMPRLVHQ